MQSPHLDNVIATHSCACKHRLDTNKAKKTISNVIVTENEHSGVMQTNNIYYNSNTK